MVDYQAPLADMRFLAKVFDLPAFWQILQGIGEVDAETAEAILEEAAKLCEQVIAPLNREADEQGCKWHEGEVTTPSGFKEAYQTLCEGGWIGLGGNPNYEGLGMPKSLASMVEEMIQGACMSFGLAPMLSAGACLAIDAHASDQLKSLYLPKLYSGEWAGAMDLTEPHAGTDLGLIRTKALPQEDGTYAITGTKIFITWGEHDLAANIVHLVLAKLPDAPPGSRGISLFIVPKILPNQEGGLGERNAVACGSLEKKMGIKASATCVMNFDGATGWLVGEPHKGLAGMFTMMNYERLVVGIQALGTAEASYQNAKAYALERLQSRAAEGATCPDKEADPIIVHPDVRRMLLQMKATNEASRAFYIYVAMFLDAAKYSADPAQAKQAQDRVALLTPVAKAFISDLAFDAAVAGQQVFGGHGYVREWGQEQFVRDIRITQIYEGTNGIQAMDLIGRKTVACKGKLLEPFIAEINEVLDKHAERVKQLEMWEPMAESIEHLQKATQIVITKSADNPNTPGAVAVDYLHMLGFVAYGYMWVRMALCIDEPVTQFDRSKINTARYFMNHQLSKVAWLAHKIEQGADDLMRLDEGEF